MDSEKDSVIVQADKVNQERRRKSHFLRLGVDKRAVCMTLSTFFVDKQEKLCIKGGLSCGDKNYFSG